MITKLIIMGSVCLHNFIIQEELQLPGDMQQYCPQSSVDRIVNEVEVKGEWREDYRMDAFQLLPHLRTENLSAVRIRDILKDYFLSDGRLSWQQERVDQGTF